MSGTARSHSRLRARNADLLDRRGRGMSDRAAADMLRKLDRAAPDSSRMTVAEAIAAVVRLHPEWPDADIARRVQGCDDAAMVAEVRARLAAGRQVGRDGPPAPDAHREPTGAGAGHTAAPPPPPPGPPSLGCDGILACMPTFTVTTPDGSTATFDTWQAARMARARSGGTLVVTRTG